MPEIKCPQCKQVFKVDESSYAAIVSQVRDKEFNKALAERKEEIEKHQDEVFQFFKDKEKAKNKQIVLDYKQKIKELENELETQKQKNIVAINKVTEELKQELHEQKEKIAGLNSDIKNIQQTAKINEKNLISTYENKLKAKDESIESAKAIAISNIEKKLNEEIHTKDNKIVALSGQIDTLQSSFKLKEKSLKENFAKDLKAKDDIISYWKDYKTKMSTKLLGESLEKHCQIELDKIRATAFPNVFFEKDNDVKSGSKGDFIFRDFTPDGIEFVSIMFEMKNEMETTATKKKNEDFFKELDKDRKEKNCEYAVLVSMLESDNELYNTGIVDVSHKYPKMYVVRPQFFIQIITLIRNAALNTVQYKKALIEYKAQNIDISNFENKLLDFKDKFSRNYDLAKGQFNTAIAEIDKTIEHLQKVKENLLKSDNNLRLANDKLQDVSIKKLTKDNPTMIKKFSEIKSIDKKNK